MGFSDNHILLAHFTRHNSVVGYVSVIKYLYNNTYSPVRYDIANVKLLDIIIFPFASLFEI